MKVACAIVATAILSIVGLTAQQPARDAAPAPIQGTGVLAGVVMIDGPDARPARGAVVTINRVEKGYGDTAVTDERGRFEFRGVPTGRYMLAAEKQSYVTTRYGATRPGRAGTPIAIGDGQLMTGVTLRLVRGAVLTGTVRDADGEPAPGVGVGLNRVITTGGERRILDGYFESEGGSHITDDRGVYRLYGLSAGDYVVHANPSSWGHDAVASGAHPTTVADVAWAKAILSSATGADARTARSPAAPPVGMVSYASIYYPNTLQRSEAAAITLAAGEERSGIDFTLQLMPTYRVSGVVRGADGGTPTKPPRIFLAELGKGSGWHMVREWEGTQFSFDGVAPGAYAAVAIEDDSKLWAIANITVGNQDQSLSLTLQPGLTVAGTVVFQGTQPVPTDLTRVEVYLSAVAVAGGVVVEPSSTTAKANGTFTFEGLVPGSYRLGAGVPETQPRSGNGWVLRSAMLGNQDIADVPLDVRAAADIGKIVVTFTDRPTELSGHLQDASGRAAADYFIIVYSADERTWFEGSRRIAQTRPASDGHFSVRGLPPGDYLIAALTDVERGEWFNTGFLRELVPGSVKVTLGEGEKKTQDIRIKTP